MIGDYSIMDWVTLGGIVTTIGAVLTLLITTLRDNKAVLREFEAQSKEHTGLTNAISGVSQKVSDECEQLSKEHYSIKDDTRYIRNEMLREEKARENLYNNSSRAKEILETIDIMREVVIQNSKLNAEIAELKVKNQNLLDRENVKYSQLNKSINRFQSQLAGYESYSESEEIRVILKKIEVELSEYVS